MKLVALFLVLVGCATPRDYRDLTKQVGNNGIQRYDDKEKNVSCWVYRDSDGSLMACLKNKDKKK